MPGNPQRSDAIGSRRCDLPPAPRRRPASAAMRPPDVVLHEAGAWATIGRPRGARTRRTASWRTRTRDVAVSEAPWSLEPGMQLAMRIFRQRA